MSRSQVLRSRLQIPIWSWDEGREAGLHARVALCADADKSGKGPLDSSV